MALDVLALQRHNFLFGFGGSTGTYLKASLAGPFGLIFFIDKISKCAARFLG
jgi:hypothetical protein